MPAGRVKKWMKAWLRRQMSRILMHQYTHVGDLQRLTIADTAVVNNCFFNLYSGKITIGEYAFFGHNVCILTGTHDYRKFGKERLASVPPDGRDVIIEYGAWVGSNVTILGPCTIGEHAVVAAGSVVTKSVAAYTVVAGVPARVVRTIEPPT